MSLLVEYSFVATVKEKIHFVEIIMGNYKEIDIMLSGYRYWWS